MSVSLPAFLCICTYHIRNNYATYILAMQLYFGQLYSCFAIEYSTGVATMSYV